VEARDVGNHALRPPQHAFAFGRQTVVSLFAPGDQDSEIGFELP
jgi:hypothetical protein